MREQISKFLYRYLPSSIKKSLGGSKSLRFARNQLLRDRGRPRVATGTVQWEKRNFQVTAPYRTLVKAQTAGIENRICRVLLANVPVGGVCVDVGANCGFVTLVMASRVGESGHVISFEPNPFFHDIAVRNIDQNAFGARSTIVRRPVGRVEGAPFQHVEGEALTFTTLSNCLSGMALPRVDAIKIDVDGADIDVLLGGESVIRQNRPLLIVEMADHQQAIFDYLRDLSYSNIVGMDGEPITSPNWPANIFAWDHEIKFPPRGGC